jgi:uncharacterized protein (TIGR02646 family)
MIRVNRGPAPSNYLPVAHAGVEKLKRFFAQRQELRAQLRPPVDTRIWQRCKPTLIERFHAKCCYCESSLIDRQHADVENFRPKSLYWWLTYDWENLLIACRACNVAKADRFPLEDESERATGPSDVARERPLLLNPSDDTPDDHLVFGDDGSIFSDTPRGQATIDCVMLNRPGLVVARKRVASSVSAMIAALGGRQGPVDVLIGSVSGEAPYAATARQVLARAIERLRKRSPSWLGAFERKLHHSGVAPELTVKDVEKSKSSYIAHQRSEEAFKLPERESDPVSEHYFAKRRVVERIEIKNFKAIRSLDITLAGDPDQSTSWLMMLGENATGKSSILKAIALALMDVRRRSELGIRAGVMLSRGGRSGRVRVWLSGVPEPFEFTYRETRVSEEIPHRKSFSSDTDPPGCCPDRTALIRRNRIWFACFLSSIPQRHSPTRRIGSRVLIKSCLIPLLAFSRSCYRFAYMTSCASKSCPENGACSYDCSAMTSCSAN